MNDGMRLLGGAAVTGCIVLTAPAQAASPLDELIEPVPGKSACFARVYDAAHLQRNPKQKTTVITVWLKYQQPDTPPRRRPARPSRWSGGPLPPRGRRHA